MLYILFNKIKQKHQQYVFLFLILISSTFFPFFILIVILYVCCSFFELFIFLIFLPSLFFFILGSVCYKKARFNDCINKFYFFSFTPSLLHSVICFILFCASDIKKICIINVYVPYVDLGAILLEVELDWFNFVLKILSFWI